MSLPRSSYDPRRVCLVSLPGLELGEWVVKAVAVSDSIHSQMCIHFHRFIIHLHHSNQIIIHINLLMSTLTSLPRPAKTRNRRLHRRSPLRRRLVVLPRCLPAVRARRLSARGTLRPCACACRLPRLALAALQHLRHDHRQPHRQAASPFRRRLLVLRRSGVEGEAVLVPRLCSHGRRPRGEYHNAPPKVCPSRLQRSMDVCQVVWPRKCPPERTYYAQVKNGMIQLRVFYHKLNSPHFVLCSAVILWMAQSSESDYEYSL